MHLAQKGMKMKVLPSDEVANGDSAENK